VSAQRPTEICITIDTEFSIGGNFADPRLAPVAAPVVLGEVGGKEHGLGFLLDRLCGSGVRATFFVEALQTAYFGDEPMGGFARRIAAAGQDVQLHLHPCWLSYEGGGTGGAIGAPNDSCAGRSDAELDRIFAAGFAAFARWELPRPVAVRAGNFQADMSFYRAAERHGLRLSSNIALAAGCAAEPGLRLSGGRHRFGRVLELPVLSYLYPLGRRRRLRLLAITASSVAEIGSVLRQARERGISPVVLVTHPQEFVKHRDVRYSRLRRNRVNQARLEGLLRFVGQHPDEFAVVPMCDIASDDATATGDIREPEISVSALAAFARMVGNGVNDRVWWY
jgi:hypothetical protein